MDKTSFKLGTLVPTMEELPVLRTFFQEGCDFYWSGDEAVKEVSLTLFRSYPDSPGGVCRNCAKRDCVVRQKPFARQTSQ